MYIGTVKQNEKAAISNSQVQADQTKDSDTCKIYPDQELCVLARKIAANPTVAVIPKDGTDGATGLTGSAGAKGESGRGVTSFNISPDGALLVNFTDGATENVGKVVGKEGASGINGINGTDGRGILSAGLDSGNLIIRFTDGTTQNVGMVVGPSGKDGATGATGPAGPTGAKGADGISVIDLKVDNAGYVQVTYSNGDVKPAGRVIVNTITKLSCQSDTLTITMADGSSLSTTVDCTPDTAAAKPAPTATTAPLVKVP